MYFSRIYRCTNKIMEGELERHIYIQNTSNTLQLAAGVHKLFLMSPDNKYIGFCRPLDVMAYSTLPLQLKSHHK